MFKNIERIERDLIGLEIFPNIVITSIEFNYELNIINFFAINTNTNLHYFDFIFWDEYINDDYNSTIEFYYNNEIDNLKVSYYFFDYEFNRRVNHWIYNILTGELKHY